MEQSELYTRPSYCRTCSNTKTGILIFHAIYNVCPKEEAKAKRNHNKLMKYCPKCGFILDQKEIPIKVT